MNNKINFQIIRNILLMLVSAAIFGVSVAETAYSNAKTRRAFVVGVSDYKKRSGIASLVAPAFDAKDIRDALGARNIDFIVDTAINEQVKDKAAFFARLDDFLSRVKEGEEVLFYFSGHGYNVPDEGNYFLLQDAKSESVFLRSLKKKELSDLDTKQKKTERYQQWLKTVAVSEREVEERINAKYPDVLIIIADACRNFIKNRKGAVLDTSQIRLPDITQKGTFRLYSAGPGQVSLDSERLPILVKETPRPNNKKRRNQPKFKTNSLFTRVLLKELKVPRQEINILAAKVKITVRDNARNQGETQIPDYTDHPDNTKYYFWRGDESSEMLTALCRTAKSEYEQLRYAALKGSVGRDRLQRKLIELSRCTGQGDFVKEILGMMRMEARGTSAIGDPFDAKLPDNYHSDDPVKVCDARASSPLDPNRPREVVRREIQKYVFENSKNGQIAEGVEEYVRSVAQACQFAVQERERIARLRYNSGRAWYALALVTTGDAKKHALKNASRQLDQAVVLGYEAAYNDLALLYQNGEYFKEGEEVASSPNRTAARELFQKGARLGHIVAQYNLGMAYINGGLGLPTKNVTLRNAEAYNWLSRASERGYVPAMIETARAIFEDRGIEAGEISVGQKDNAKSNLYKKAEELLKTAASKGSWEAMFWLGHYYRTSSVPTFRDLDRAIVWFARAAEAGDTRAQANLAEMLTEGHGVPAPQRKAAGRYWRLAAEAGSKRAQMQLARLLSKGQIPFRPQVKEVDGGASEIRDYYMSAFHRGEVIAGFELAKLYKKGFPVGRPSKAIPEDPKQAIDLFRETITKVKDADPASLQANPMIKVFAAFQILQMHDEGKAKLKDGSDILTEDEVSQFRAEYGDYSEFYKIDVTVFGEIECGYGFYNYGAFRPKIFIWNWKNRVPPTKEQFEWWKRINKCVQNVRKREELERKSYSKRRRRRFRELKESHIGIPPKIQKVFNNAQTRALRDAKRLGPKAKTFTQRIVDQARRRAKR